METFELDLDSRGLESVRFAGEDAHDYIENHFTAYETERLIGLPSFGSVLFDGQIYALAEVKFEHGRLASFSAVSAKGLICANYNITENRFEDLLPDRDTVTDFLQNYEMLH